MTFALTPAQQLVVEKPWDTKMLVTAGAGAGKTTTLTHRLEHLVSTEKLGAGEILALSFSRAAVRELRDRTDHLASAARRVRAQTFDGWAFSLLLQAYPERGNLAGTTFDKRIELAIRAIDSGAVEFLDNGAPAHVLIDEVQDLVGVRREMVEALLDRFGGKCGFTVVGDAAQSIYAFQVFDPGERSAETNRFFDWVRASFADHLVEVTLDHSFRARTPEARIALPYGARLQSLPSDQVQADAEAALIHSELRALLCSTPDFGNLSDPFVQDSLRLFDGTTAILGRNNGQVLVLSEQLHTYGVPHRIQRSPYDFPTPSWVAELLLATGAATLTEDHFMEIVPTLSALGNVDPVQTWRSLRRVAPGMRRRLDLETLRRKIAERQLSDELAAPLTHPLVLSTIHRAKGLEFDRVLIMEPEALSERRGREEDAPAEARLLYVAMTRTRDDLYRLACPDTSMLRKANRDHPAVERWYVGGWKRWVRKGMEGSESDVSHEAPAGIGEPRADPVETQNYLLKAVGAGDEVELRRLHDLPMSPNETPQYGIFHAGRPIGETSKRFRHDLWRLLKQSRGTYGVEQWPYRITGLHIDALETVAGLSSITDRHDMGDRGVWLAPRLCGLGRFDWTYSKTVPEGHRDQ